MAARVAPAPDRAVKGRTHRVAKGETLWRISQRYGVSVDSIMALNGIDDVRELAVGQLLQIEGARAGSVVARGGLSRDPRSGSPVAVGAAVSPRTKAAGTDLRWPVKGTLTSGFGKRMGRVHDGIDIGAPEGAPVFAAGDGEVVFAGEHGAYGNLVILKHPKGLTTVYAHNKRNVVKKGQQVSAGDMIAVVGQTGRATGPHVHFEVRQGTTPKNPVSFLPR